MVRWERHGMVAMIVLDDAARRNALSSGLVAGVLAALDASRREGARAIVLASAQRAFCAGADIREMLETGWLEARPRTPESPPTPPDLFAALEAETRPVLAAVDGLALGGGLEMVLCCDLALASPRASFALPEIGLGVIPNTAIARLPGLIGPRAALDLMLTRRRFDAAEAVRLNLVNRIAEDPVSEALGVAAAIVDGAPPGAIAAVKQGVKRGPGWDEAGAFLRSMRREEWTEGFSAFLEKRTPEYDRFWEAS